MDETIYGSEVSRKPRGGTAVWGLCVLLAGLGLVALGLHYTVNATWVVAGALALLGVVFLALALRTSSSSAEGSTSD